MPIFIPIPIGCQYVAVVQDSVCKVVTCERCRQDYGYMVNLEAVGSEVDLLFFDGEGASARARELASERLEKVKENTVEPVPCPGCGFYQDAMVRRLKEDASINPLQVVGATVFLGSFALLALGHALGWLMTFLGAAIGLSLLIRGYLAAFRFDPNAGDPEPRRAAGRQRAIWGEQLAKLLHERTAIRAAEAARGWRGRRSRRFVTGSTPPT